MKRTILVLIVVFALMLTPVLHAGEKQDMKQHLKRFPEPCKTVLGFPDLPATLKRLEKLVGPVARRMVGADRWKEITDKADKYSDVFEGPLLIGLQKDVTGPPFVVVRCTVGEKELTSMLREVWQFFYPYRYVALSLEDRDTVIPVERRKGILVVDPEGATSMFCILRDGMLFAAASETQVRQTANGELEKADQATSHFSTLLDTENLSAWDFFGFDRTNPAGIAEGSPGIGVRRSAKPGPGAGVKAVLDWSGIGKRPRFAAIRVREKSVRMKYAVSYGDKKRSNTKGRVPPYDMFDKAPITVWGNGADFRKVVPAVKVFLGSYKPGMSAELGGWLAESKKEAGVNIQKDVMGRLGPDWGFEVLPPSSEQGGGAVFVCDLHQHRQFVNELSRFAEHFKYSRHTENREDLVAHFVGRVRKMDFHVGVTKEHLLLTSNKKLLRQAIKMLDRTEGERRTKKSQWRVRGSMVPEGIAHIPGLVGAKGNHWTKLLSRNFESAKVTLKANGNSNYAQAQLQLDGISGQTIAQFLQALQKLRINAGPH